MKGLNMKDDEYQMKEHYDFSKGRRGAVIAPRPGKTRITIRIDDDILNWFRDKVDAAGGGNYQSLINEALREHINMEEGRLEATLRKVIREELGAVR
jgi:uncharacterized protein (DUF4415 family)